MAYTAYLTTIEKVYIGYLQRPADPGGLIYWAQQLDLAGGNINSILPAFAYCTESQAMYGPINNTTIESVVTQVYSALFNRAPDPVGKDYWVNSFKAGTYTASNIVYTIMNNAAPGQDRDTLNNKLLAADLFTKTIDPGLDNINLQVLAYPDMVPTNDLQYARTWLAGVTSVGGSVPDQAATTQYIQTYIADPGDPIVANTFVLTTGTDTINATGTNNVIVKGLGDAAGTFTTGDTITGNATTALNLDLNGTAGLATVTNVGTVNANLLASTPVNAALWTGVSAVNLKSGITAGDTLTLTNADIAATYGLSTGIQTNETVTFRNTAGTSDTAKLALGGTGTSATVRSTVDLSSANTIEGATITTSGKNFDTVNLGTGAKTVTVLDKSLTETGTNDLSFGPLAATLTFDASAATGKQTLTFQAGSIDFNDTIKGGTGTSDTVTANSSMFFAKMTGVETFVTTLDGGVGFYDGANVTGLNTMTVNQGTAGGAVDLTNMKAEFTTLNINGPTEQTTVDYLTDSDATLTVNYGAGSSKFDTDFDGLSVDEVKNLTVNFNVGGVAGVALGSGDLRLDRNDTTSLTLVQAGSDDSVGITVDRADSLDTFILRATADNSSIYASPDFSIHRDVQGLQHLEITASGVSATAYVNDWGDINWSTAGGGATYDVTDTTDAMSLQDVKVTASGSSSSAYMNTYIVNVGHIDSILVEASGNDSYAYLNYTVVVDDDADGNGGIGELNVIASGHDSYAYVSSYISVFDGDIDLINVLASGNDSYASLDSTVYVYRGNIGDVVITASGTDSSASGYAFQVYDGNIGTITVDASGYSASAYVYWAYVPSGDVGEISITASGDYGYATFSYLTVTGDVGPISITASGESAFAYLYSANIEGDLDSITITASGESSSAYFSYLTVTGDVGPISLTASGDNAYAYVDTFYIYGDVQSVSVVASGTDSDASLSTMYVSGDIGSISVIASGNDSSANAWVYETGGAMNVGTFTVAATGPGTSAYLSLDTGTGSFGTGFISATKANASATFDWEGNSFGSITATTGQPSADIDIYLNIQTTAGGTITASGSGTLDIDIQGKSISALSAGSTTNSVTVDVTAPATAKTSMTLTTGSGADTVQGGSGVDTFNLGTGADYFVFSNVDADVDTTPAGPTDIIAGGFTSGTDKLDFTTAGGANYTEVLTPAATVAAYITAADTALNGVIQYYFGVVGTDGYLAWDSDGTGITSIVKLTGVTDMAATDIT